MPQPFPKYTRSSIAQRPSRPTPSLLAPDWGHAVLNPDGKEIRIPQLAFTKLGRMGLLSKNREVGMQQIAETVYQFMSFEYDGLMDGLRQLLGYDMSGPAWLQCRCRQCQRKEEEADKTSVRIKENKRGRYWLKVIRTTR